MNKKKKRILLYFFNILWMVFEDKRKCLLQSVAEAYLRPSSTRGFVLCTSDEMLHAHKIIQKSFSNIGIYSGFIWK